jgi:hypothetical protein
MPDEHLRDQPDPDTVGRHPLLPGLLDRLDRAALSYTVQAGPTSIRVTVRRPGWRWELTFTPDGGVQIQRFRVVGCVERDPARLDDLFHEP